MSEKEQDDRFDRLRQEAKSIYDGFASVALNGVICSIPDEGLHISPHRTWCARCQKLWKRLYALTLPAPPTLQAHGSANDFRPAEPGTAETLGTKDHKGIFIPQGPRCIEVRPIGQSDLDTGLSLYSDVKLTRGSQE